MKSKQNDTSEVVTKGYLKQEFSLFRLEMNDRFDKMQETFRDYHNDILNGLDKFMGELAQIREDQLFIHRDLKDHEKRITRLKSRKN